MRSVHITGLTVVLLCLWIGTNKQALGYSVARGCYNHPGPSKEFSLIGYYRRGEMDWVNLADSVIKKCEKAAKIRGYKCFAIQFYGECWSGPNACEKFKALTPSTSCFCSLDHYRRYVKNNSCPGGVGGERASFVYKVVDW